MAYETVLQKVGDFGLYQKLLCGIFVFYTTFLCGINYYTQVTFLLNYVTTFFTNYERFRLLCCYKDELCDLESHGGSIDEIKKLSPFY